MERSLTRRVAPWAIRAALLGSLLATPLALQANPQASAQAGASSQVYQVAAGSLASVLRSVASQSNLLLSFTAEQTSGKSSAGVHGRYAPASALAAALAGSGLQAVPLSNGGYILQTVSTDSGEGVLAAVKVRSTADDPAVTEGSGSYGASSANIAGKEALPLQEIPGSVSVLTRQRMDDQNITTIQQGLRYVTGVESVDYGDGTAYFMARGNLLGIQYDGVSIINGLQYQSQFDMALYDRVEVLRGPSSVTDDASTDPGGTVNMVRKRPQDQFHLSTETQLGSFGSGRQMVDVTGPLNQQGTIRGRLVLVGNDALQSVQGTRDKYAMVYGALDFDLNPHTTLQLSAAYEANANHDFDYGAPGVLNRTRTALLGPLPGSYDNNYSPNWNHAYTSLAEFNANLVHHFDHGWKWDSTVFYRRSGQNSDYAYSGAGALASGYALVSAQRQHSDFDWFGADTHFSGPIEAFGQSHLLTVGANYSLATDTELYGFQSLHGPGPGGTFNLNDPNTIPDPQLPFSSGEDDRLEQYGVYAQAHIHLADPLTLVLGGREMFLTEQTRSILPTVGSWDTTTKIDHRFLPTAGLVWDITPSMTAYASYAKFLAAQTETTYLGALLPPRSGEQAELGIKNSFLDNRLSTTAAIFRIEDNNRAIQDPLHPTGDIAGGRARDEGIEFEVNGQVTANWNIYAGYTYLNERYADDTANLSQGTDPKHLFKLWTHYKFSDGPLQHLSVGGGMVAQSAITRGVVQGGYAVLNLQAGYQFNSHLSVALQLNNLADRNYYIRPPSTFFSVFGDRRNTMLTVRYQL